MVTALRVLALSCLVTLALDAQAPATRPAATASQRIVGTWQLMTRTVKRADGRLGGRDDELETPDPLGGARVRVVV